MTKSDKIKQKENADDLQLFIDKKKSQNKALKKIIEQLEISKDKNQSKS